jgi:hypothetical protein
MFRVCKEYLALILLVALLATVFPIIVLAVGGYVATRNIPM